MPNKTDEILAEFEKLLRKKRGAFRPTDRLGLERAPLSREFQNEPMPGYEKAAAILSAALSPGSTIASMVLAPPTEETIFERQITGPDGKQTILPRTSESVVPKMRKRERAAQKPNPIMDVLQRHFKLGPHADPVNDIASQKINDRNFLVHASRPGASERIREVGGILPGKNATKLPEKILDDPIVKNLIAGGRANIYRSPFSGKISLETEIAPFSLSKNANVGIPGTEASPGVSLSRQMTVPALNEDKSYRFLLDPADRKTFSTAEPGFAKAGQSSVHKRNSVDLHESEQRTYGETFPVKPGTRAITPDVPKLAFEERVDPRKVDRYRATMGNETLPIAMERLGTKTKSRDDLRAEYNTLKKIAEDLWAKFQNSTTTGDYTDLAKKWMEADKAKQDAFDAIYK